MIGMLLLSLCLQVWIIKQEEYKCYILARTHVQCPTHLAAFS